MTLFYIQDCNETLQFLPKEESRHAIRVLRLQTGDLIAISNGVGSIYTAKIVSPNQKMCEIEIFEIENAASKPFRIHIAIAPTKLNDRFEWMLEKMTEIGVDEITPVISQRSERKVLKLERMNRIIISAIKQSWKAHKPILNEPVKYPDFIKNNTFEQQFIAHCNDGCGQDTHLQKLASPNKSVCVLIGPEGDFSESEVKIATQNNWIKTGLGSARLRTETAGLVSCLTLNLINEG